MRMQHTRWDQAQDRFLAIDYQCVTSIMPTPENAQRSMPAPSACQQFCPCLHHPTDYLIQQRFFPMVKSLFNKPTLKKEPGDKNQCQPHQHTD